MHISARISGADPAEQHRAVGVVNFKGYVAENEAPLESTVQHVSNEVVSMLDCASTQSTRLSISTNIPPRRIRGNKVVRFQLRYFDVPKL